MHHVHELPEHIQRVTRGEEDVDPHTVVNAPICCPETQQVHLCTWRWLIEHNYKA
jgi:hypothetical protein